MEIYIYCLSNKSMPGILNVGITEEPDSILIIANKYAASTPFVIELIKRAPSFDILKRLSHKRVNEFSAFYYLSVSEFMKLTEPAEPASSAENSAPIAKLVDKAIKAPHIIGCRDMSKCFVDGQKVRHVIGKNKIWIGVYSIAHNGIIFNDGIYTLSKFVNLHYSIERPARKTANAWAECETLIADQWITTANLPEL